MRIELTKPTTGSLGFSLIQGEKGSMSALYLKTIAPGGSADVDERLQVGDRLLQVIKGYIIRVCGVGIVLHLLLVIVALSDMNGMLHHCTGVARCPVYYIY